MKQKFFMILMLAMLVAVSMFALGACVAAHNRVFCANYGIYPCVCDEYNYNGDNGTLDRQLIEYDFFLNEEGNLIGWNDGYGLYSVYINRHDGYGFVSVIDEAVSEIGLQTLELGAGGKYTLRIFNDKVVAYFEFVFKFNDVLLEYNFSMFSHENLGHYIGWNASDSGYWIYVDRHDGYGFAIVPVIAFNGRIAADLLGLTEGANTIKVARRVSTVYYDGVILTARWTGEWEIEFEHRVLTEYYVGYHYNGMTYNGVYIRGGVSWFHDSIYYRMSVRYSMYIDMHNLLGFVFFRNIAGNQIFFGQLPLSVGKNTIRVGTRGYFYYDGKIISYTSSVYFILYRHEDGQIEIVKTCG